MDWQTITTSVIVSLLSSSVITSAIIYVLKRSFDKALDLKFEQLLEKSKLETQEQARRKTELFDKQAQAYQQLLSLVYRVRNISRELREIDSFNKKTHELFEEHLKYAKELQELIYENRAILPDSVFLAAHRAKNLAMPLVSGYERYLHSVRSQKTINEKEFKTKIEQAALELDETYTLLVDLIQPRLGIVSD
jgi:hypothetical protein